MTDRDTDPTPTDANASRDYIATLADTACGRTILRAVLGRCGATAVIAAPRKGDAASSVRIARLARAEFARRYPQLA